MISSMTGYGRAEGESSLGSLAVEIKSVNHRYLDSRIRLPRQMSSLEPTILNHLKTRLDRGRVEISVRLVKTEGLQESPVLNIPLAQSYLDVAEEASNALNLPGELTLEFILRMPDVLQVPDADSPPEETWNEFRPILDQALDALSEMRAREGDSIVDSFKETMQELETCRAELEKLKPEVVEEFKEKFQTRLDALLTGNGGLEPARLHQEVALFADRCDISEELDRLASHFTQFSETMKVKEPIGRRLDFLLQEMFREVNTIGSKANHFGVTKISLQMKNSLEKLREQAQNVE